LRLFFALWPPSDAARALAEWAREVQRTAGGRATAEETIHLTLAFLGEADPENAVAAAKTVRGRAFEMKIDAAKYWRHNRIVWVGPAGMDPGLRSLVAELHGSLKESGFVLDDRPFAPHITLIRKASAPTSIPSLPAINWRASEFLLVKSVPGGRGSRYEPVERFALKHGRA
jgi:2'-5' RNA ligase